VSCCPVVVVKAPKSTPQTNEEAIVIDSPSSSSDHDCCIVEDLLSSHPIENSGSDTPTQHPNTPTEHSVNAPIPLFSLNQPNMDHTIQSNGDHISEDHMISPGEDQEMSKNQPQCKGLQMLSQYDSDDSELEPGEVV